MPPVIVFSTTSDIEASVVLALLDSQGIAGFRISGNPQAILPMSMSPLGEIRIAVPEDAADDAIRIIDSHREDVGARVVRIRDEFDDLETRIEYRFRDRGLLEHALTHKSRAAEDASGGVSDNESLEFLGDAVLGLVVADALFHQYPSYDEGQKSKIKAAVVSTQSLARHAEHLRLGEHLILGRGEEKTGGRFKQALLAMAMKRSSRRSISTAGSKPPRHFCAASSRTRSTKGARRRSCAITSRRFRSACRRSAGRCPSTVCRGRRVPITGRRSAWK
jgi:ribonuclease-3